MSDRYNGWANYATWRVNLEICSDYCDSLREDVEGGHMPKFAYVQDLAYALEEYVDEAITCYGINEDGIAVDYARAFVNDVDWYEIAEHWENELIVGEDDEEEEEAA